MKVKTGDKTLGKRPEPSTILETKIQDSKFWTPKFFPSDIFCCYFSPHIFFSLDVRPPTPNMTPADFRKNPNIYNKNPPGISATEPKTKPSATLKMCLKYRHFILFYHRAPFSCVIIGITWDNLLFIAKTPSITPFLVCLSFDSFGRHRNSGCDSQYLKTPKKALHYCVHMMNWKEVSWDLNLQ